MKKLKFVALSLVVVFMLSLSISVVAEDDDSVYNYVVLGSSQANGFGLHGCVPEKFYNWTGSDAEVAAWNANPFGEDLTAWNPHIQSEVSVSGYRVLVPDSYPDIIGRYLTADGYNVVTHQLGMCSSRPEELTVLLDDSYDGDAFTDWRFTEGTGQNWFGLDGGIDKLREDYQKTIAEADYITYDLGVCNFTVYMANQITNPNFASSDVSAILDSENSETYYNIRSAILSLLSVEDEDSEEITHIVDTIAYAVFGFEIYFDRSIELIYELNPDVDMTVVSLQNVVYDCEMTVSDIDISVGDLMGILIDDANEYAATESEYCDNYSYAYVSDEGHVTTFLDDLQEYSGPEDLTQNFIDCLNIYDNNFFLAERVTDTLENEGYVKEAPANAELYEDAMNAAYDTAMLFLSNASNNDSLDYSGLTDGSSSAGEDILYTAVCDAALASVNGHDYKDVSDAAIADFEELNTADKSAFSFEVITSYGNAFFAHPTPEGCYEAAQIIYGAKLNNTSGATAMLRAFLGLDNTDIVTKSENAVTSFTVADIYPGSVPAPKAEATSGTPVFTYSNAEDGTYGTWEDTYTTPGTYYVKAVVAESFTYKGCESIKSFKVLKRKDGVATPAETGVDQWLVTDNHIAYIGGYEDGTFKPEGDITRAETAVIFWRLLKDRDVTITKSFSDVPDDAWYSTQVGVLASLGILAGYEDGTFRPNGKITRAEFVTIALRFGKVTGGTNTFSDISGHWAENNIISAVTYGWVAGDGDGKFRPDGLITRGEAVTIINRILNRTADTDYIDANVDNLKVFSDVSPDKWYYYNIMETVNAHEYEINKNGDEIWK